MSDNNLQSYLKRAYIITALMLLSNAICLAYTADFSAIGAPFWYGGCIVGITTLLLFAKISDIAKRYGAPSAPFGIAICLSLLIVFALPVTKESRAFFSGLYVSMWVVVMARQVWTCWEIRKTVRATDALEQAAQSRASRNAAANEQSERQDKA